jgi:Zn-dependent protease with chaperone function
MPPQFSTTAYRYPNERLVLALTLAAVLLVIAVTATATLCGSALFVALAVGIGYFISRSHHQELLQKAQPVTTARMPRLAAVVRQCTARLQPGPLHAFVAPTAALNAYAFGLASPYGVVLNAGILEAMDEDEVQFIIGHELGHIRLGHTRLNTLVGGMAGIPSPFLAFVLLQGIFLWWNRACEYSADRAGLLACGKPEKAVSALVRLAGGPGGQSPSALREALRRVEAEDDSALGYVGEALSTHPMIVRRITALKKWAASRQYRDLQKRIAQNDNA